MHQITIAILIVNALCVIFLAWGIAAFQKRLLKRRIPNDYQKLRPDTWILVMAMAAFWMGLLFAVSFVLAKTNVRPIMPQDLNLMPVMALVFFLMSGKIVQSYFYLLGVSPKGLAWWTPGRGKKGAVEISWKDVKKVSASGLTGRFAIQTKTGPSFGNYFYGTNTPALLDALEQNLPKSAIDPKARIVFEKLRTRIARYSRKRS